MKTLPSMSGLLPAQFKSDPASSGIGWSTINPMYIKKIKDRSKVIVSAIINNSAKVVEGEIVSTDGSNVPIMIKTEYGVCFWCHEDAVSLKEDNQ